jgi:chromosome segregation ATPase
LIHDTEPVPEVDAVRIPAHAKSYVDRARRLEGLSLFELAQRVAVGLARLRAEFGLETADSDPLTALFAALPRTEVGRRGADLERELAAAREEVLDRERAAADVERRSESLKEALRERSADLATALSRAESANAAQRELEALGPRLAQIELEREALVAERERAVAENERLSRSLVEREAELAAMSLRSRDASEGRAQALAQTSVVLEELERTAQARDAAERERDAAVRDRGAARKERDEFARERDHAVRERDDATRARDATGLALDGARGRDGASARFSMAVSAAAGARARSAVDVLQLDREALAARLAAREQEYALVARERDLLTAEIAHVRTRSHGLDGAQLQALADAQRVTDEFRREIEQLQSDLAWRTREMDAVRATAGGVRWKLLGGDLGARITRWSGRAEGQ